MILPSSSVDEWDEKSLELHFMAFGENQEFGVEEHYIDEQQFANANTLQDRLGHKGRGRGVLHHPICFF